ncbi:hypothetical protein RND81_12G194900 [Saponaria officinalis]|uniref:Uncharacterized protein n=1 Tax=Saponaria officinalis TaxID=3572 RepID=A0AAW1HCY8_SAPOF
MNRLSLQFCKFASSSSLVKPLVASCSPLHLQLTKKYSKHEGEEEKILDKERAPSTAEIMDELSHEKEDAERTLLEKSEQGFVSQTSDKVLDAAKEAVAGDADPEAVKEKFKEGSPGQTYHKPRDDGGVGPTGV